MQTASLHTNVGLLRVHAMLREFNFLIAVIVPFIALRSITMSQFLMIQGAYMVALLLVEPLISPLADKYGRRPAILVGSAFWFFGHIVMWVSTGWQSYAMAEGLLGIGMAAFRPATRALLYDSLLSLNRAGDHYAALTKQDSLQAYAGAAGMLLGGVLFMLNPQFAIAGTVLVTACLMPVAWMLKEAPYHTRITEKVLSIGRCGVSQAPPSLPRQLAGWWSCPASFRAPPSHCSGHCSRPLPASAFRLSR